jgi:iron-sulfur cluster assembly accessory protein
MNISSQAVSKVKQLIERDGKTGSGLRVAVQGGGCSGFQYGLTFEAEPGPMDTVVEVEGLKVFVDPMSSMYLEDVEIDYSDGLNGSGFEFKNPKATGTCGCGSSFSV